MSSIVSSSSGSLHIPNIVEVQLSSHLQSPPTYLDDAMAAISKSLRVVWGIWPSKFPPTWFKPSFIFLSPRWTYFNFPLSLIVTISSHLDSSFQCLGVCKLDSVPLATEEALDINSLLPDVVYLTQNPHELLDMLFH